MLAGDVTASFDGGLLTITGDAEANEVMIVGAPDGSARVIGLNDTTVNGGDLEFSVGDTNRRISVSLGDGDDQIDIKGVVLALPLEVVGGNGNDFIEVSNSRTRGVSISGNAGDDVVKLFNVYSLASFRVQTNGGDDTVAVEAIASSDDTVIETGAGNDSVAINHLGSRRLLNIDTGSGNDTVFAAGELYGYRASFSLGDGDDNLNIAPETREANARFRRSLQITGSAGNDNIIMDSSVQSFRSTVVDGGAGTDSFQLAGATLSDLNLSVESDTVADLATIVSNFYDSLAASGIDATPYGGADNTQSQITTSSGTTLYTEGDSATAIDADVTLSVPASSTITGATIAISTGFQVDQDVLSFTDADGITGSYDSSNGTLTLTGSATSASYQSALRAVLYENTSEAPDITDRIVTYTLQTSNGNPTATKIVGVSGVNGDPTVSVRGAAEFNAAATNRIPLTLDPNLTIEDEEGQIASATVTIGAGRLTDDVLNFTSQTGITGTFTASTGVLSLTGDASVTSYQEVLRTITLDVAAGDSAVAGDRTIDIEVTDVDGATATASVTVTVLTTFSPTMMASADNLEFSEGDAATTVDSGLVLNADAVTTFSGATIRISTNYQDGEDALVFNDQDGISGSYDSTSGTLTLTGTATVAEYQSALRSITYANSSEAPDTSDRVVTFTVITSKGDVSATRTVAVASINDAPVVTTTSATVDVNLSDPDRPATVVLDDTLTVEEVDTLIASATVSITSGRSDTDVLTFTESDGVTGVFDLSTGILTFSGDANAAVYESLLRTVEFGLGTGDTAGDRTVVFSVTDTLGASDDSSVTIDVSSRFDANVSATASTLEFTEGDSVEVDNQFVLNADTQTTVSGATVQITDNYQSAEDVLVFVDADGIAGSFETATGILTLTGAATAEQYQSAIRSVRYNNTSDLPNESDRVLLFTVTTTKGSPTADRTMSVTAVNDQPVVTTRTEVANVDLSDSSRQPLVLDDSLTVVDPDSEIASAKVTITSGFLADDVLAFTEETGVNGNYNSSTGELTFTGNASVEVYQRLLRSVTLETVDAAAGERTISFEATDDAGAVAESAVKIQATDSDSVTVQSSAGTLSVDPTTPPIHVDDQVLLSSSTADVTSAQVQIVDGFESTEDRLTINQGVLSDLSSGLFSSYNSSTGILTITGDATAAVYQSALRAVEFRNEASSPVEGTRTIEIRVNSSGTFSAQRLIEVSQLTSEQSSESVSDRDDRLINEYAAANNLTTITTASGLQYVVTQEGNGTNPTSTQTVRVNYTGTYLSGVQFDANDSIQFSLQSVIVGWTEGIPKFSEGGSGILLIPSRLAYGSNGPGDIPDDSILRFDIDLIEIV